MSKHVMEDAFAHNTWATLRVIDTCLTLGPGDLQTSVPGTYGSILDTMRHLVGADASYLFVCTGEGAPLEDEDRLDLTELRAATVSLGPAWSAFLASEPDPDRVIVRHHVDGSETSAPLSIRLAQVVHHGTDHRSQICTALTNLGIEPPDIDLWAFGEAEGTVSETPPTV
jgi:uncharacterized damage-inducible protein DinB